MPKRSPELNPYQRFLSRNRSLNRAADLVLEGIGEFAGLNTAEDFRSAARALAEEGEKRAKEPATFRTLLDRNLLPKQIDRFMLRRLALAGRATQVVFAHSPWHHQIVCALLLSRGVIVQMPNGAGKTLAIALAATAEALAGRTTHIVTSNDYLAERDCRWMGRVYQLLGFSVGVVFTAQSLHFKCGILQPDGVTLRLLPTDSYQAAHSQTVERPLTAPAALPEASSLPELPDPSPPPAAEAGAPHESVTDAPSEPAGEKEDTTPAANPIAEHAVGLQLPHTTQSAFMVDAGLTQKQVLSCDVVYGKMDAFGFAYLNDNLAMSAQDQTLTRRDTLIVDECDSVLLDDLRLPLIVTRPTSRSAVPLEAIGWLHRLALSLIPGLHFLVEGKSVRFTYEGLDFLRGATTGGDLFTPEFGPYAVGLLRALEAIHAYRRDDDYIVYEGAIVPVDVASGRLLFGRQYGRGLHEALEYKEGIRVRYGETTEPVAVTTIKHFALQYSTLAGTSGAIGVPEEYRQFYGLDTVEIEPYPRTRHDYPDLVFQTQREAVEYGLIPTALEASRKGQPVLVNLPSLKQVGEIAERLAQYNVPVQVLDASTVQTLGDEADKVRRAGSPGLVTVCSRVAARGTDIILDPAAKANGGLLVIGLQRAMDRRYDDQLRGRAARHGDPGASLFVVSLEDELLRSFAGEWVSRLLQKLGMDEGVPIESGLVTNRIEGAQRAILRRDHAARSSVVELDDIVERHRTLVYRVRQKLLEKPDIFDDIEAILENWIYLWQQNMSKADPEAPVSGAGSDSLHPFREHLGPAEVERIMNVRNIKARSRVLQDAAERVLARALQSPTMASFGWKPVILTRLDYHWRNYLAMEAESREDLGLYPSDEPAALAKYAQAMEEHFDAFFLRIGDEVLADVLTLSKAMAAEATR